MIVGVAVHTFSAVWAVVVIVAVAAVSAFLAETAGVDVAVAAAVAVCVHPAVGVSAVFTASSAAVAHIFVPVVVTAGWAVLTVLIGRKSRNGKQYGKYSREKNETEQFSELFHFKTFLPSRG